MAGTPRDERLREYRLAADPPARADYLRLRRVAGLSARTEAQADGALAGSWCWCTAVHLPTGQPVAMGRVIGDGGWYFQVADMATDPGHQRRGLGRAILRALLERIEAGAPPDPFVTLMADPPGRALYRSLGFVEAAPGQVGMVLRR